MADIMYKKDNQYVRLTANDLGAASSEELGNYLPLTGGTLTGSLDVNSTGVFVENTQGSTSSVAVKHEEVGRLGVYASNVDKGIYIEDTDGVRKWPIVFETGTDVMKIRNTTQFVYNSPAFISNFDRSSSDTVASNIVGSGVSFLDNRFKNLGYVFPIYETNGAVSLNFNIAKEINGVQQANYINLYVLKEGGKGYSMSNPAAFRSTLGLGQSTGSLGIAYGGTGATSTMEAANNLCVPYLGGGTKLPSNVDLNNYKTPGNYYCALNTEAETLGHCPTKTAFWMEIRTPLQGWAVLDGVYYIVQRIYQYDNGIMFHRFYTVGTNAWNPWYKVSTTIVS